MDLDFGFNPMDWAQSLKDDIFNNVAFRDVADVVSTGLSSLSSFLPTDGNAGEADAKKFMDRKKEDSYFDLWTRENDESSTKAQRSAWDTLDKPKPDTNVIDRLMKGANTAWEKDPLEVLKFGSGMVGGYFKADRENKLQQAQIDAYNKRIAMEEEARASQNAAVVNYKPPTGKRYKGPLLRKDGSRVFNPNGTVA